MLKHISTKIYQKLPLEGFKVPANAKSAVLLMPPSSYSYELVSEIQHSLDIELVGAVVDSIGKPGFSLSFTTGDAFYTRPGREQSQKSLGRWPNLNQIQENKHKMADFSSVSQGPHAASGLLLLDNPGSIVTISDSEPWELYKYMSKTYPLASKLGIIAAQTPFLNGNPFTLIHNDQIYNSGTVGISLQKRMAPALSYGGFKAFSKVLTITEARGNILVKIEGKKASDPLLEVKGPKRDIYAKLEHQGKSVVVKVSGGDAGRGTLALETTMDIAAGMTCQFMDHRAMSASSPAGSVLSFATSDLNVPAKDEMYASSELGLVISYPDLLGGTQSARVGAQVHLLDYQ